jgi:hypothetical protein
VDLAWYVAKGRRAAVRWRARSVQRCATFSSVEGGRWNGVYVQWAQWGIRRHAVAAEEGGVQGIEGLRVLWGVQDWDPER